MNDNEIPASISRWITFLAGLIVWGALVGVVYLAGAFIFYSYDPATWGAWGRFVATVLALVELGLVVDAFTDSPSGQE